MTPNVKAKSQPS